MVGTPNRSIRSGTGWQLFRGAGIFVVVIGSLFWTIVAGADATRGVGGLMGAVAGYALLLGIGVGLLYSRHRDAFTVWTDASVADRLRANEEAAVTGRLDDADPIEGLDDDRVAGFEYHLYRDNTSALDTAGEDIDAGWVGPDPLTVTVDGDRIEIDPDETAIRVDGDRERFRLGLERARGGVRETRHGGRLSRFVGREVDESALDHIDEVALGDGLKGHFRLRYWPLPATDTVYLLGAFDRERPGEPFGSSGDTVVVGAGTAAERADAVTTWRRRYRLALYALGGLFVVAVVGQAVFPALV